ncbi:MAG TPA: TlpA disulfide reductase family protein [Bacillota bacterium]|nr:TlpA disulfide reductase family protein [Bacillota bacterium]
MKKRFIIILAFMMVFGLMLMPGCGAKDDGSSQGQDGTDKNGQTQAEDQSSEEAPASVSLASFRTQDIDGNEVNQDIFKDYPLTLVNVWGTYCGPCLEEMPYLGELHKEYADKGVNIVGIVIDAQDEDLQIIEDQRKLVKEIVEKTGADYTHLVVSNDLIESVLTQFDAIPASFFVDSSGNVVSELYIGSRSKKDWVDLIEKTMEKQQL